MGFLPCCSHFNSNVLLYHSNEMPPENVRWELHKNAICCLERILEAATYKTAAVWLLSSQLTNHLSKMNKICWALLTVLANY